jgi:hypothetical protein
VGACVAATGSCDNRKPVHSVHLASIQHKSISKKSELRRSDWSDYCSCPQPHGDLDQGIHPASSLVPWLVGEQLKSAAPNLLANETSRRESINRTLSELFNRQTGSGGLALWPGGNEPSLFASAYAASVIAGLQQQEIELPEREWQSLLSYLSTSLRCLQQIHDDIRFQELAFAALALVAAGKPEVAYEEALLQASSELSHETRAMVALAFLSSGNAPKEVIDALLDAKVSAPDAAWLYGGGAREDALRLLALDAVPVTVPGGRSVG